MFTKRQGNSLTYGGLLGVNGKDCTENTCKPLINLVSIDRCKRLDAPEPKR
jgi:hypothetical protein